MADKPFKERRRLIRFDNANINFKTKEIDSDTGSNNILQAVAVNTSAEGICFMSSAELKPGTMIELDIAIPFQPKPARLKVKIKWSRPVKTEEGKKMFDTGARFVFSKNDETRFLLYIYDKMDKLIEDLEAKLGKISI